MNSGSKNLSSDLIAILQELSQRLSDMQRRVQLCQQALALISREENATLWAALKIELGNNLAQTPIGYRAENIERVIESYQQALEVRTRQAMPVDWAETMMKQGNAYLVRIRGGSSRKYRRCDQFFRAGSGDYHA